MSDLQIFNNPDFGEIRIVERDGEPWFVGKDIAAALGYSNPRKALTDHVDDEDKGVTKCDTPGGVQELTIISESGVYSLIFSSKLEKAKEFKRWVTAEVLPTIRKQGGYLTPEAADRLAAAVQERVQAAWAESFQKLCARVEALEDAVTDPFRAAPALPAGRSAGSRAAGPGVHEALDADRLGEAAPDVHQVQHEQQRHPAPAVRLSGEGFRHRHGGRAAPDHGGARAGGLLHPESGLL